MTQVAVRTDCLEKRHGLLLTVSAESGRKIEVGSEGSIE